MVTFGDVRRWSATSLEEAQGALGADVDRLVEAGELLKTPPEGWHGDAADAAAYERGTLVTAVSELAAESAAVRRALAEAADGVAALEQRVRAVADRAARQRFSVTDDGVVVDVSSPVQLPEDEVAAYEADRRHLRDGIVDDVEAVLRLAVAVDADLTAVLDRAERDAVLHTSDPGLSALLGSFLYAGSAPQPPRSGSPQQNADWWASLSATEQQRLLDHHPERVAGLDGIPGAVRHQANRARLPGMLEGLRRDVDRLRAELDDIPMWPPGASTVYGLTAQELAEAEAKVASVERVQQAIGLQDHHLLLLDTSGERVTAAVAVGDIDTADHVAVFTPGMTTTVDGSLAGYDEDMVALRERSLFALRRAGRPEDTVAAVSWLGYQAPQWGETLGPNSVAGQGAAERGAADLAPFLQGVTAGREGDVHLTALAHSYGSTTTGLALREGTGVDDFVAFGSPGLGTSDVGDLQVGGAVYHVEAKNDPVDDLARFGVDPSHLDGVNQLSSSVTRDPGGAPLAEVEGHSDYLVRDSTSQHNIAVVVAGLPDQAIHGRERGFGDVLSFPVVPWGG
ncbi:alpha/beta hydrolase [Cellulomonas aerilata]|uniref:Alpha/beta hydrolase n=1 Tax=Cellulomonas aerilata TaxID=515326 RepID=A0A512DAR7_9CELL|nr:alpha/beta hydrolase [Cellulomonas aerilata]GEO33545.1 alpha/beta hydrolase [Cellulomonas aerilata]